MEFKINEELSLTPITQNYLNDIFNNFNQQVVKFLPLLKPSTDIENTKSFIHNAIISNNEKTGLHWVILKEGAFIGLCGIRDLKSQIGDFGLWIKTVEQGKGYGTSVVKSAIDWAFMNCDLKAIKYGVDKNNFASVIIIESLGAEIVDTYLAGEENCLDILEYQIKKSDWIQPNRD